MIYTSYPYSNYQKHQKFINKSILRALSSGTYINSKNVKSFEKEFANYLGSKYCVGVANCTDAIYLSLIALKKRNRNEVILPAHTAPATLVAVLNAGLTPIFCDIDESNFNLDVNLINEKINKKTLAVCNVHLYGQSNDITKISSIVKKNKIYLIEDCAQSAGADFNMKKLGTFGVVGCHSFFPTKNLSTYGDGGCITTNNKNLYEKLLRLREYGWNKNRELVEVGINSRLDEIHASILRYKLKFLDKDNAEREKIAHSYLKSIKNDKIKLPQIFFNRKHVFHHFVIRVKNRIRFLKYLSKHNFKLGIHYSLPLHKHSLVKKNMKKVYLPITEKVSKEIVSLPIYQGLKPKQIKKLINLINKF